MRGAACPLNIFRRQTTELKSRRCEFISARTLAANALIAVHYLARHQYASCARHFSPCFCGAVGRTTVNRVWRKVKSDGYRECPLSWATKPIVRLFSTHRGAVRLDRKATSISLLSSSASAHDGQTFLLAINKWRRSTRLAQRARDLLNRGLQRARILLIVDGGALLETAMPPVWMACRVARCSRS